MRSTAPWIAFLITLFLLVGLCGLFASYAVGIPLERAVARSAMLDQLLTAQDAPAALERLQPMLDSLAPTLNAEGPLATRVAATRAVIIDEQRRESSSLDYRIRLMLVVITILAAALGAGIVALARKAAGAPP